jgi:hypothetical protein
VLAVCIPVAIVVYTLSVFALGLINKNEYGLLRKAMGTGPLSKPMALLLTLSEKARLIPSRTS